MEYDAAAGRLANILTDAFTRDSLLALTTDDYMSAEIEIEISLDAEPGARALIGKVVIDIMAEDKVRLDKPKLTKMLKGAGVEWPALKVFKQAVPQNSISVESSTGE